MSRYLVNMLTDFVDIFKTLRSLGEIDNALKTLLLMHIPIDLAKELDLKNAIRGIRTNTLFEEMKDKIIAKIDNLEKAVKENKKPVKSSGIEKKAPAKKEKKPRKRAAEASGFMEPAAKKKPLPTAPIFTSSQGFRIPKKNIAPTPAPGVVNKPIEDVPKREKPTVSVMPAVPIPLMSLVLEKPNWLSERILSRY